MRVLDYASGDQRPPRGEQAAWWWARAWYALGGIVLPVICWVASFGRMTPPVPEYQSGRWTDWVGLCFDGKVAWPLFPFIGGSVLAMLLLLIRREFFGRFLVVRLAIYTGLLQAVLFAVLLPLALGPAALFSLVPDAAALVIAGFVVGLWLVIRAQGWIAAVGMGGFLVALTVAALVMFPGGQVFDAVIIGGLGAGPFAMALAFACMLSWLWNRSPIESTRRGTTLSIVGWTSGYAAGWSIVAMRALDAYAALPKTPPHCYIATAAARGHRRFVGAAPILTADGLVMLVNPQLRVLKCGELVLQAFFPQCHAACRRVYDCVGPRLAQRLTHAVLADAAYVGLKPFEWLTRLGLRFLGVNENRLYRV